MCMLKVYYCVEKIILIRYFIIKDKIDKKDSIFNYILVREYERCLVMKFIDYVN